MKCKEVLKLLRVTRQTLCRYVKEGKITGKKLLNGSYDYDEEAVYKLLGKGYERKNVIYCRVSTSKQKNDLKNQKELLENFCMKNGIVISDIYEDVGSGINFDRKEFQRLLNDVINNQISKIYITYCDRLSRISYKMFEELFKKFNCEIIVLNKIDNEQEVEKEIIGEIIDLIHCFSMKVYSNRRKEKLTLVEKDLRLENEKS